MATISSLVVNETIAQKHQPDEADTPTTPRASKFPSTLLPNSPESTSIPVLTGRRSPTPSILPTGLNEGDDSRPGTSGSIATSDAMDIDEQDADQKDSDDEDDGGEDDGELVTRKKRGQRFFCTGYPPCNLSFTRSEHLARHIRKHTGERPFQCHCNRRFSRLDNLRQHAQTVHVNEEIPNDSLAATGTRFQRQIRTDRVRQGPRPRSGTMSSTGSYSRGHSRNLSASSVTSTSSAYSTVSEAKRRPPPLLMASDATRPKLGIEPPTTPPAQYTHIGPHSPGGLSTPTSATWSVPSGSPSYGAAINSPISAASRLSTSYANRTSGRRLSVPSGPTPYQSHQANTYQYPMYQPSMAAPSTNASNQSSVYASPTSSSFTYSPAYQGPPNEDWRRRTWHPSTYTGAVYGFGRPATSGLTYSQTPDAPQPAHAQHATAAAGQAPRLPGIESFDQVQHRPSTPPRRQPSPVYPDFPSSQPIKSSSYPELDDHGQVAKPASWSQQTIEEIHRATGQIASPNRPADMGPPPPVMNPQQQQHIAQEALQISSSSKRAKRQGWYNGPLHAARTSPEDSSSSDGIPTPGTSAVEVNPMIMPSHGFIDNQHHIIPAETSQNTCLGPPPQIPSPYVERSERARTTSFGERSSNGGEMNRLEALVAVATSGEATAAR